MSEFFGHFHVVLVHLPIGILLLACVFQWLERRPKFSSLHVATNIALLIGMICAILSALTGYLLSFSGDYDEGLVITHQWFGISVAAVSIAMFYYHNKAASFKTQVSISILLFVLIIITGHLGGSLTHGSDYLTKSWTLTSDTVALRKPIPNVQEAMVYPDVIQPILQTKCYSCHGKNKQKGKLRMDDSLRLMKGGKDGPVIIPGNVEKSEMAKRISLPREDDDHMPPKEKPQPTEQEIALIHWWIKSGASFDKKVKQLDQPEELKPALLALQNVQEKKIIVPDLPAKPVVKANDEAIKKLKDIGAVVDPVAQNTNYLSANFVTVTNPGDREIQLLLPLKEQLIELKLSGASITDSALLVIAQFKNLMRLQLDHTKITDKGLASLRALEELRYLNLVGTAVTEKGVMQLKDLKNLRSIYLYQTGVKKSEWKDLKKAFPKTLIDSGGYTVPFLPTDTIEVKPPKTKQ
ncbi:MAG TPA: c-type cytochrome domain-containing protein [Chitinophagaceae bacterium]|nr:c-type cytochrome domain-containing protein [Chitinophagaceae bacterium]